MFVYFDISSANLNEKIFNMKSVVIGLIILFTQ